MRRAAICIAFVVSLFVPEIVLAQTASILGTVTDSTGGALPGVTVEAASPALIEGVRTAVTDERGLFRILELRPGSYKVTFKLQGFGTEQREGVTLTTGFTATVNASMAVGGFADSVTVTRQLSQVDTVNSTVQSVISQKTLDALPLGQSLGMVRSLTAGAVAAATAQDVGGNQGEATQGFAVNGGRAGDFQQYRDGMLTNSLISAGNWLSSQNPSTIQEVVVSTGGFSAGSQTGGGAVNIVQREGSNAFNGMLAGDWGHKSLQSDNLNEALGARGARTPAKIRKRYDIGGGFGGPIVRNKLWFYQGLRYWTTSSQLTNNYYNATQGSMTYTPDLTRPAYDDVYYAESNTKLTWQAAEKHKITATYAREKNCNCFFQIGGGTLAPEAAGSNLYTPNYRIQGTWTYAINDRLLLWAGVTRQFIRATRMPEGEGQRTHRSILELNNNYRYNAPGSSFILPNSWGIQDSLQANQNVSLTYLAGQHMLKIGATYMQGDQVKVSDIADGLTYTFRGGVPQSITLWATPFNFETQVDYYSAYIEDQWRMNDVTLNFGVRYDGLRGGAPAQHLGAGPYVPERNFDPIKNAPSFNDFNPRGGIAYDLGGRGRTALKASISRTVQFQAPGGLTQANNPVNAMVTSANRTWSDANGDFIPQESELGPLSNANFGKVIRNTFYEDDVIKGWHKREYSWQASATVQHEFSQSLSATLSYFRTWYGNFTVTRNRLVDPAVDYDTYCITAPTDTRLPVSGQQICGLADLKQAKFGQVSNWVTPASQFGDRSEIYNGFTLNVNARVRDVQTGASVATGRTAYNNCQVVNSPQDLYNCKYSEAWYFRTQFKAFAVATLPWDIQASAVYQLLPSIPLAATYSYGNAQSQASLGRPLSGGATATRSVALLQSNQYSREGWNNQVDFKLSKSFRVSNLRIQPEFAIYNLLNANPVLGVNNTFGSSWQTIQTVLGARTIKLGGQIVFGQ